MVVQGLKTKMFKKVFLINFYETYSEGFKYELDTDCLSN